MIKIKHLKIKFFEKYKLNVISLTPNFVDSEWVEIIVPEPLRTSVFIRNLHSKELPLLKSYLTERAEIKMTKFQEKLLKSTPSKEPVILHHFNIWSSFF